MDELDFWGALEELVRRFPPVVDRPKGSAHPRYPSIHYPLNYGYLNGSTSTDGEVLDLTTPILAVASCGLDNSYGHPHDEVVELLRGRGIELLRTDLDGTVTVWTDGAEISVYDAA